MSIFISIAAATVLSCPAFIQDEQRMAHVVNGWDAEIISKKKPLEFAKIYNGHPSRLAQVRPENTRDGFRIEVNDHDSWVACEYENTQVRLLKVIPEGSVCSYHKKAMKTNNQALFSCSK